MSFLSHWKQNSNKSLLLFEKLLCAGRADLRPSHLAKKMAESFGLGMLIVFFAGIFNGSFTLPMKYSRVWSWENIWIVYSGLSFLTLPWILAIWFVPGLVQVYHGLSWQALFYPAFFGLLWGIAQTTFGIAVNMVGMAVAYVIVCGLVCVIGAIVPILILSPADLFQPTGLTMLASMFVLLCGLALYGIAGSRRDREMNKQSGNSNFKAGFALCIFTGVVGGAWNLGFSFSRDIVQRSNSLGASSIISTYAVWAIVLSGALLPNVLYPAYLLSRNGTWTAFAQGKLYTELGFGISMALIWFLGIIAYGIGATLVGKYGTSVGFTLFIAATILASTGFGAITGEWSETSVKTRRFLAAGVVTIFASVFILHLGSMLLSRH